MSIQPAFDGCAEAVAADDADYTILILGDSVANETDEWGRLWTGLLADRYSTKTVRWYQWLHYGGGWQTPVAVQSGTGSYRIDVWNGAEAGYGIDDVLAKEVEIIQAPPNVDLVLVALGHNTTNGYPDYYELVDTLQADWPSATIVLSTQNPGILGDPWESYRLARVASIADAAGLSVADTWAAFDADPDIKTTGYEDSVHLNPTGSAFYADAVEDLWVDQPTADIYIGKDGVPMGKGLVTFETTSGSATINGIDDITADATVSLECIAWIELADWTTASTQRVFQSTAQFPIFAIALATGGPRLYMDDGTVQAYYQATDTPPWVATPGGYWVRWVADIAGGFAHFYTSAESAAVPYDEVTWVELGDPVAITQSFQLYRQDFYVSDVIPAPGDYARIVFFWDGTKQVDVDFTALTQAEIDAASFIEDSLNVGVVTLTGVAGTDWSAIDNDPILDSAEGLWQFKNWSGSGDWLDEAANGHDFILGWSGTVIPTAGSDHWIMEGGLFHQADDLAFDFGATDDFTAMVTVAHDDNSELAMLLTKKGFDVGAGWAIVTQNGDARAMLADGAAAYFDDITAATNGATVTYAMRRTTADAELELAIDGILSGSPTTEVVSDLSNANELFLGSSIGRTQHFTGKLFNAAVWSYALTDVELLEARSALAVSSGVLALLGRRPAVHVGARR